MDETLAEFPADRMTPEQLADRLARLQQLTGALSRASTVSEVTEAVLSTGVDELAAAEAWVCLLEEGDDWFEVVAEVDAVRSTVDRWRRFPRSAPLPAADALERDELVVWESLEERDRAYPALAGNPMANEAYIIAPMIVEGVELGAVVLGFESARRIDEAERAFVRAATDQTAQAVRRAQLGERERRAHRWQRFLADASMLLSRSLRYEDTLREVADLAVPTLADGCVVHLSDAQGLKPVAVAHAEPQRRKQLDRLVERQPVSRNPYLLGVAETHQPLVLPEVTAETLGSLAEDDEHRELLTALGVTSGLIVPLIARERTLGTLTLVSTEAVAPLGEAQLAVAEDLAARAALSIDNARAYERSRDVSRVLQRSLLPPELPTIPGAQLAARHQPATDIAVGGDFYDVIDNGDGSWTLLIGDVCGKDAAAAALTGLARHTARATASKRPHPAEILDALNDAFLNADSAEQFCTAVCLRLVPDSDGARCEVVVAGHPPPIVARASGEVEPLAPSGQPVGMFGDLELRGEEVRLGAGDGLLLHTDGITEARDGDGMFGEQRVLDTLRSDGPATAEELADRLLDAVSEFEGFERRDDIAILVVVVDA